MTKILLRAGKSPFDIVAPATVYWDDLIAKNSGNLLFAHSAYKMLSAPGTKIDVTRYKNPPPSDADEINEKYDKFIIPLANAFRPEFEPQLKRLTALIRKLKIPCVVVGVGAQASIDSDPTARRNLDGTAKQFLSAVLDKSHSVGVRGAFTAEYLHGLGFKAVEVIGCPSMFLYGDNMAVTKRASKVDASSAMAFNLTGEMPATIAPFYERIFSGYANTVYVPQSRADLAMLLWGLDVKMPAQGDPLPTEASHPVIQSGRARFFTDVSTWIDFLKRREFSFGTRIHGNVFAILAGTPGFVIAHDSRTLELARYFEIPHRKAADILEHTTVDELYQEADYRGLVANHPGRFAVYKTFLEKNGIDHIFAHTGAPESFEARLAALALPEGVVPMAVADPREMQSRTASLAADAKSRITALGKELTAERNSARKKTAAIPPPPPAKSEPVSTAQPDQPPAKPRANWWSSWRSPSGS